jgi:lysophospholipase L1-like esterase
MRLFSPVRQIMTSIATSLLIGAACAAPVEVLNKGIGGNTTRDGLRRYARDVKQTKPDHLILYFGMNDALNSGKLVPLADFRTNLQEMIDRAGKLPVKTLILVTPNPIVATYVQKRHPKHPQKDLAAWLEEYDQVVRELAKKNHLPLADLRTCFLDAEPNVEAKDSLVRNIANSKSADGVHPTPAGYKVMAKLIADTLGDAVKPGDRVVCFGDSITFGAHVKGAGTATGETYPARLAALLNGEKEAE